MAVDFEAMQAYRTLPVSFYRRPADQVARDLLGRFVVRELEGERLVVKVVETEAYLGVGDRASHGWSGRRTRRNRTLFEAGGVAYVYLIYGLHYCLNAVTGAGADGSAVLLRAGEPLFGLDRISQNRSLAGRIRPGDLAGGPGKLCQALSIDRGHDGQSLDRGELRLTVGEPETVEAIAVARRVGVDYAGDAARWPLRFAIRGNRHVSRPRPW